MLRIRLDLLQQLLFNAGTDGGIIAIVAMLVSKERTFAGQKMAFTYLKTFV